MHELSLAMELVSQVERIVAGEGATRAVTVAVSIGALSGVEREAFEFAFPLAAAQTCLDGARLEIESVPVRAKCRDCGVDNAIDMPNLLCGSCGSCNLEITAGREFVIHSVEVV